MPCNYKIEHEPLYNTVFCLKSPDPDFELQCFSPQKLPLDYYRWPADAKLNDTYYLL